MRRPSQERKCPLTALAAVGAAAFLALFALLLTTSGSPSPAHAQASPSVAISLSDTSVERGTAITATMSFSNLASDSDTSTTDYVFRADVVDADGCEGGGMGKDRHFYQVDEDTETREATVSASCPAGAYTVRASLSSAEGEELSSATADFSVAAPPDPSVSVELAPSDFVEEGNEITATMSFGGLASDSDTSTIDYVFRADALDSEDEAADDCEGNGLGADRNINQVDDDPETRTGTISAECPAGSYTLRVSISSADDTELASASAGFFILRAPEPVEPPTLTALSVSHGDPAVDVTLSPAFDSATLAYRATVRVAQVTVAPTASDADATVAYRDGNGDAIADADAGADGHQVDLDAGSNTVRVAVSKDSLTTTYTISLFRLVTQQQQQDDATLSALTLSDGTLRPAFDAATTEYRAAVKHNVEQITVTPAAASGATVEYLDRTGGAFADADSATGHQVDLAVSETEFKVRVNNGSATETYTVTMERDSARVFGWTPSRDINAAAAAGNTNAVGMWGDATTLYVSDSADAKLYAYTKATGARDADKDISLHSENENPTGIWSDGTTLWVADDTDVKLYAYTLAGGTRVSETSGGTTTYPKDVDLHNSNDGPSALWGNATHIYVAENSENGPVSGPFRNLYAYRLTSGSTYGDRDTDKEFKLFGTSGRITGLWSDGTTLWATDTQFSEVLAYSLADKAGNLNKGFYLRSRSSGDAGAAAIWSDGKTVWIKENIADGKLYSYNMLPTTAGDTTLSALTATYGSNTAAALRPAFAFGELFYRTAVPNSAAQVTITPTPNMSGSTLSVLPADADSGTSGHQVDVRVGTTVIDIKVTASNGDALTYRVVLERDSPLIQGWTPTKDINGLFEAGNTKANGLWSDGTTVWVGDYDQNKLYAYTLATGARAAGSDISINAISRHQAQSLWSNGTTIWVAGHGGQKIFAYTLAGGAQDSGNDIPLDHIPNSDRSGIWSDGTTMWVVDATDDKVYAYAMSDGKRQDGTDGTTNKEFDLDALNSTAGGLWSNGTTMWVSDLRLNGNKLYAYTLASGTRDSANDILLYAGNARPTGLWANSDGTTIWVADDSASRQKVYSYNMAPATAGDTTLTTLTVSDSTLRPAFTFGTGTYRAAVPNSAAQVTVTPTANNPVSSTITIDGEAATSGSGYSVNASVGVTMVEIKVTSSGNSLTYSLVVERDSAEDWGWTPTKDINSLTAGDARIWGIWANATTFYIAHDLGSTIYAYNLSDGSRDADKDITLDALNQNSRGIWSNGTTLWAVDYVDKKLYAYKLSPAADYGDRDSGKDINLDLPNDYGAVDVWSNDTIIWVSDYVADKLYAYTLATGVRDADKDINLDPANTLATGIWSDDTIIWVSDHVADKLYAYALNGGARDTSQEFALPSSNGGPRALWADGTSMWMLASVGKKVFSYTMPAQAVAPPSTNDATLSGLTLSAGTLRPPFATTTKSYRAAVEHSVEQVTVTPAANAASASIEYLDGSDMALTDADTVAAGHQVAVAVELTTFQVKVTDGTATETYTVTMERDSDQPGGWTPTRDINTARAAGNDFTRGVWGNATTLYVADSNDNKVYAYTRSDGTRNSASDIALDSDNGAARGIWSNGTTLWVADESDVKVYAYTLGTKARDTASEFALDSANDEARGIWSDGTTLWVADDDGAKVYAYTLDTKARDTASEFALHQFNTDAWGIWSDRTTLWVADVDGTMYAYTLAGVARDTAKEFSLHSENTGPDGSAAGIWSDGTTLWVADLFNDKIYTYILPRANNEATGEPTISGTNLVGQTQTANKGSIADADGVPAESTFTYQWIHFLPRGTEFDITGANSKTYTTVAADAGKFLRVKVDFTDDAGNDESRTSAASEIIGYTSCTPAAPQDAIWSACLTPEHSGGSVAGYEFVSPTSMLNFGALSDTEFTVGGTTYTIDNLETLSNSLLLAFTSAPGNAASDWVLHIGSASTSFALSAATTYEGDTEYQWNSTGQNWINVPVRSVWLTAAAVSNNAPVFPSGTITRSVAENTASGQNVGAPVAATDDDTGDTLTYSLEGADSGSFTIVSTSGARSRPARRSTTRPRAATR